MDDKVVKIEFNIWANSEEEGKALSQAIGQFINFHGQQGRKVTASKLTRAIGKWQDNALVRSSIINYFK